MCGKRKCTQDSMSELRWRNWKNNTKEMPRTSKDIKVNQICIVIRKPFQMSKDLMLLVKPFITGRFNQLFFIGFFETKCLDSTFLFNLNNLLLILSWLVFHSSYAWNDHYYFFLIDISCVITTSVHLKMVKLCWATANCTHCRPLPHFAFSVPTVGGSPPTLFQSGYQQ